MAKDREMGSTAFLPGHRGGEGRSTWGIPGSTYIDAPSATDTGWAPWSDCPAEDVHSKRSLSLRFRPFISITTRK